MDLMNLEGSSYGVGADTSPEDLIGKALLSSTTATAAQTLTADQMKKFVRLVIDETVGLHDSTMQEVIANQLDISNMDIPNGQYAVGLGPTTAIPIADEITPVFDRRILSPVTFDFRLSVEQTTLLRSNIERGGIEQTVDEMMATYQGNVLENEFWNSAVGGAGFADYAGTGNLTQLNGWLATARAAGHVVDFAGARMSTQIFRDLLKAMPTKWRGKGEVYYASSDLVIEWAHYLEANTTHQLGDMAITADGIPTYMGRKILPIPMIRDDYAGVLTQSGSSAEFTQVLLTNPLNKVIGYSPDMQIFVHPRNDGKVKYTNAWGRYDVEYFNVDRVCVGVNINPIARCSIACD